MSGSLQGFGADDGPVGGWLARRGGWARLGLSVLAGALMTAGHPPVNLPWVLFLSVPALVWLSRSCPTARASVIVGWGAGFGYFVTGLHWVGHAFQVDPDRFAMLTPLGVIGLPAGLALFWALAFWAAHRMAPGGLWARAQGLLGTLTAAELARGYVLTGFPWALPGYVWVETPAMQAASWAGPFGMTLLTLALCGLPLLAFSRRRWALGTGALAVGAAIWAWGAWRIPSEPVYAADAPVMRLVQPNAPQAEKWLPGHRDRFYARLLQATAAPAVTPPDVIVWPETAVAFLPAENPERLAEMQAAAGKATLFFGALHREPDPGGERWANSLFTLLPDGTLGPRYDKHHLVPFGEYLPLAGVLDLLGLSQFAIRGGFAEGPGPQTLSVPGVPAFSPLICYEAVFPYEVTSDDRPDWLVQITNDAWFGTYAGPEQHLAQARIRAIEQGLPVMRAANTGISAVITPHGLMVASIPMHNYGYVDHRLPKGLPQTIYSRTGDIPATLMTSFLLIFGLFPGFRRRRN